LLDAAQGLFVADTKDSFKDFEDSVQKYQDATPMSHNNFLACCVDAIFNTDITVKIFWSQVKRERRNIGDLFLKTILTMLRARGAKYAPTGEYAQLGVNDYNLGSNLHKAINTAVGCNPLVEHLNVTSHAQPSLQLISQLNSFHRGKYSAQGTDQGMQVPNANLLQGDFICAVFKNSIQKTIVRTLKSWDQGESDYQTLYVTTMIPYYLQIHTHMGLL
jgi:hypothetical protein